MERNLLALVTATLVGAACGGPHVGSMLESEFQTALVDEPDGRVSLYSGHLIGDSIARGEDLESLAFRTSFLRVRVPRSLLATTVTAPDLTTFISLEEAYPGVEILLHEFDYSNVKQGRAAMINTSLTPGDPWLSGHAQVTLYPSSRFAGGVHSTKYSGTFPMGVSYTTWGSVGCSVEPGCPALRYDDPDPCRWPLPLPSNWILSPQPNQAATLAEVCGNR